MNKQLIVSCGIILIILFSCVKVSAQTEKSPISWGVKIGLSLPTIEDKDYDVNPGFIGGIVIDRKMSRNFFFRSGIEFVMKGAKFNLKNVLIDNNGVVEANTEWKERVRLNYLQVPITIGYRYDINKDFSTYITAGPYVAYGIYGKEKSVYNVTPVEGSTTDASYNVNKHEGFDSMNL